jgi:hypothetical protein
MVRYIKEGPSKQNYGLSSSKNKTIDSRRRDLSITQASKTKRTRLGDAVSREGGRVSWDSQKEEEALVPYTKDEHNKLRAKEDKIAQRISRLNETYNTHLPRLPSYDLDNMFTGEPMSISYSSEGELTIEKSDKGKVYTITEANSVLRNLDRYLDRVEKQASFKKRHGDKSKLEATASGTAAILGIGLGGLILTGNMTGNVIGTNLSSTPILGSVLLIAGLLGAFLYFRKKN